MIGSIYLRFIEFLEGKGQKNPLHIEFIDSFLWLIFGISAALIATAIGLSLAGVELGSHGGADFAETLAQILALQPSIDKFALTTIYFFFAAFIEEGLFRHMPIGFMLLLLTWTQNKHRTVITFVMAIFVSLIFGYAHAPNFTPIQGTGGVILSVFFMRTWYQSGSFSKATLFVTLVHFSMNISILYMNALVIAIQQYGTI